MIRGVMPNQDPAYAIPITEANTLVVRAALDERAHEATHTLKLLFHDEAEAEKIAELIRTSAIGAKELGGRFVELRLPGVLVLPTSSDALPRYEHMTSKSEGISIAIASKDLEQAETAKQAQEFANAVEEAARKDPRHLSIHSGEFDNSFGEAAPNTDHLDTIPPSPTTNGGHK